jgi:hypothetical protein
MKCPSCARDLPGEVMFCPACAAIIDFGSTPTATNLDLPAPHAGQGWQNDRGDRSPARTSDFGYEAQYVPGTTLIHRYRIVSPLGKGGMGEVYRAEDLKLGQTVALKFLPKSLGRNAEALMRFTREVRMARQVSHPNVCRVFDMGEADGQAFLTMEYVDGEDLASLLRRIGQLPQAKGVDIARQTCAGLAAAHEHGIVHRDLKPANIMLDGRGRVRITDFGLATVPLEPDTIEARAGTPGYMSPEQLSGAAITVQSDLYSLGLVLYEVFTGKRPFDAQTFDEMMRQREQGKLAPPSRYVKEIDPLVDRMIMRCLDCDPAKRPASALQLAATLPGGDPLAAALAAGETPSPEMVAAAGEEGALQAWKAWTVLCGIALLLACCTALSQRANLINFVPGEKSPEVLSAAAREIANSLGYTKRPADSAYWFDEDVEPYLDAFQLSASEFYRRAGQYFPSPVRFSYRQSPQPIQTNSPWLVRADDPVPTTLGDLTVGMDTQGRLQSFRVIPYPNGKGSKPTESSSDWPYLFERAGLNFSDAKTIPDDWYTTQLTDQKFAWEVAHDGNGIQVHGGKYKDRVVWFEIGPTWDGAAFYRPVVNSVDWVPNALVVCLLLACLFVARKNKRLGRGDLAGAFRGAAAIFLFTLVWLVLTSHRFSGPYWLFEWLQLVLGRSAGLALQWWVLYMALEPYIRRTYPEALISWNRLLAGRVRDALVGRDVLIGVGFGALMALPNLLTYALPSWFPIKQGTPWFSEYALQETSAYLGSLALQAMAALYLALVSLGFVFLAWKIFRSKTTALITLGLIWTIIFLHPENLWQELPLSILAAAVLVACLMRVGLLGLVVALFTNVSVFFGCLTTDFSRWYAPRSVTVLALILIIATYAFWVSTAGRKRFGTAFED